MERDGSAGLSSKPILKSVPYQLELPPRQIAQIRSQELGARRRFLTPTTMDHVPVVADPLPALDVPLAAKEED